MGKKKIVEAEEKVEGAGDTAPVAVQQKSSKKYFDSGILFVESTYNNTKVTLTDDRGNSLAQSSSGALGFKGAKKGTPFAAIKVGETLAVKAQSLGIKEVKVVVKGVGSGRESAIRGFVSKGVNLTTIQDRTPVPHNGPKPPKPRRT